MRLFIGTLLTLTLVAGAADAADEANVEPQPAVAEKLLVLPVSAEDEVDQDAAKAAFGPIVDAYRAQDRFIVLTLDAVRGDLPIDVYETAAEGCLKLTCARAVAEATGVDFVAYGAFTPGGVGRVFELKVFSKKSGRPVVKANAEAPNSNVIVPAMEAVVAQAIPKREVDETPKDEGAEGDALTDEDPGLFGNPILILGTAVLFSGAFAIAYGIAHVAVSSAHLATPEVSANLKNIALDWWWAGPAAGAGGAVAMVVGTGLIGAGVAMEAVE